ncbi:amphi-Trp domain-containing protein [Halostella pelagica]|uniref:amphi-Trp domain-containing protein n=1 Tax=Halostella pelagica TaxID=2583824 RepID=UPI0010817B95|nr:amphi-Trp domain-containing protein [Halostella pelagica]
MVQRTDATQRMNRKEMGEYLQRLGEQMADEGPISVPVANRRVQLHPAEAISCDIEVVERSTLLRGDRETISMEISWKPQG